MKSTKDYADVLKFAIQMQIADVEKAMYKPFADMDYLEGVRRGLMIAIEKIDASKFLME